MLLKNLTCILVDFQTLHNIFKLLMVAKVFEITLVIIFLKYQHGKFLTSSTMKAATNKKY